MKLFSMLVLLTSGILIGSYHGEIFNFLSSFGTSPARQVVDPMAVARNWTSITTRSGEIIIITKVDFIDAHSIHYSKSDGAGSIEIADLPEQTRDALGYDPEAAQAALSEEHAKEAESDAVVAEANVEKQRQADLELAEGQARAAATRASLAQEELGNAQAEMNEASSHVTVDSWGSVTGDSIWVGRYQVARGRFEASRRQPEMARAATVRQDPARSSTSAGLPVQVVTIQAPPPPPVVARPVCAPVATRANPPRNPQSPTGT